MEEIKISAKTLDEAKTQALLKLNTSSDHIEFKVIEEGSSGLLGFIGSKPWVISARVKTDEEIAAEAEMAALSKNAEEKKAEESVKAAEDEKKPEATVEEEVITVSDVQVSDEAVSITEVEQISMIQEADVQESPENQKEISADEDASEAASAGKAPETDESEKENLEPVSDEEAAELIKRGEDFLNDIFRIMDIKAAIKSEFDHETNEIYYEFEGDDMGVLIGKRGQTLDSLQYLVSLVVNKHRSGYIRVKLDTENYRDRRKVKLEELARNIAQKVKRSRHKVELEPMNPYERRIIHSALQNDPYVTTVSEGDEPYRHVVVILKKEQNHRRYGNSSRNSSRDGGSRNYGNSNRGRRNYNNRGYDKTESGTGESSQEN